MSRVLHGMPINTLPDPGELQNGDQIVAYKEDTGKAYRSSIDSLGAVANQNISDAFSIVTSYNVGDYCIHNDTLYKCVVAHTGEWNDNDFDAVTVTDEFDNVLAEAQADMSTLLTVVTGSVDNLNVPANSTVSYTIPLSPPSGYTLLTTTNMSCTNASSNGANVSYCNLYQAFVLDDTITGYVSNRFSVSSKIRIYATVLYIKDI